MTTWAMLVATPNLPVTEETVQALAQVTDGVVVLDETSPDGSNITGESARTGWVGMQQALQSVPPSADVIVVADCDAVHAVGIDGLMDMVGAVGTDTAVASVRPVTDALKMVHGTTLMGTVPRDGLVAAALPLAIRPEALSDALATAADDAPRSSDSGSRLIAAVLSSGHRIRAHAAYDRAS